MSLFDSQRLDRCFKKLAAENRSALVTFVSAGDPNLSDSERLAIALPDAGADIIELGMPFSDPMADGPTIQHASKRALENGMTLEKTLILAKNLRKAHPETPIILMGYFNPIYRFGKDSFLAKIKAIGVDGLIIVDLPPEEDNELAIDALDQGIHFIRLITPTSTKERISVILKRASGFIYYVSITGITGTKDIDAGAIISHLEMIRSQSDLPICVGFGIKEADQAKAIAAIADGVVVGSALINALDEGMAENIDRGIENVLQKVKSLSAAVQK